MKHMKTIAFKLAILAYFCTTANAQLFDKFRFDQTSTQTIVNGAVDPAGYSFFAVAGQGGVDDDLDTIQSPADGQLITLYPASDTVTITIRDADVSGGNIECAGGTAITLDDLYDRAELIFVGGAINKWFAFGMNGIQANSVALGTDTTGNYAAGDGEAGNALTGDSATAFFSAGTIETARLPAASTTAAGTAEIATQAEVDAEVDAVRYVTPATLGAWTGAGEVTLNGTETLTNKTLTSPIINTPSMSADSIDAITEIATAIKTGSDAKIVTGTAGTSGNAAAWDANGDVIDGGTMAEVLLSSQSASASATVDFSSAMSSTYQSYILRGSAIVAATDDVAIQVRLESGGSFKSTGYHWSWRGRASSSGFSQGASGAGTEIEMTFPGAGTAALGSASGESGSFKIQIDNPASTSLYSNCKFETAYVTSTGGSCYTGGAGMWNGGTGAITGIQVKLSSGNITSGEFRLYGVK